MRIGIVTCEEVNDLVDSEKELIPLFMTKGITAEAVVWNDDKVDWFSYKFLVIRSIWDYHLVPEEFSDWLEYLYSNGIKTLNGVSIIEVNRHKFYLQKLRDKGVSIFPTLFLEKSESLSLQAVEELGWDKAVIKPAVSASSFMTQLFTIDELENIELEYSAVAKERDLLVQKFVPEIQTIGELSIIFFNRKYSHTVLKTAKEGEFRVQSDYGGKAELYKPSDAVVNSAQSILEHFEGDMLYARVDGLVIDEQFVLMEVELLEPQLFFELKEGAIEQFVNAVIESIN